MGELVTFFPVPTLGSADDSLIDDDRWLSCFQEAWHLAPTDPVVAMVFRPESICKRCGARKRVDRRARVMFCVPCSYARAEGRW